MPTFEGSTLEERKIIVRDIIVSFESEYLPLELFPPKDFMAITQHQGTRANSEWTIDDDLKATLMRWCCHDKAGWAFLTRLRSPTTRALAFAQKVERRLGKLLSTYDTLANNGAKGTAGEVHTSVEKICEQVKKIISEIGEDIRTRTGIQYNAARILLETLEQVCERDDDLPIARRSGRLEGASAVQEAVPTLYRRLVGGASQRFILDELESVQQRWPRSLATGEARTTMGNIQELLLENGASDEYLARFQALLLASGESRHIQAS
jgi:hypothetical protein